MKTVKDKIKTDESYTIGALLAVNSRDIAKSVDKRIIRDMADAFLKRNFLSEKQIALLRPKLAKYAGHLDDIEPVQNKRPSETKDKPKSGSANSGKASSSKTVCFYDNGKQLLKINFTFDQELLKNVKHISKDRHFVKGQRGQDSFWTMPNQVYVLDELAKLGFEFDDEVREWHNRRQSVSEVNGIRDIPDFKAELYPFQAQAVEYIEARNGRVLIADEMGMGKTIEALAWIQLHTELRPVLVVCPATAKGVWEMEIEKWTTASAVVLHGKTPEKIPKRDIVIINYDIVKHWKREIKKLNPTALILDEVHKIKNARSQRSKATKSIAKGCPSLIALSGTPIENRPIEIYDIANLIKPGMFPNKWRFGKEFCDAKHNGVGWEYKGVSNSDKLHTLLSKEFMLRRKRKDVLDQLPQSQHAVIPLDITNRKEYDKAESDFIAYLTETDPDRLDTAKRAKALTQISYLRKLAMQGKLKQCVDWISDTLDDGDKLVVFATHKEAVNAIHTAFSDVCVKIDGSVTHKRRSDAVQAFQEDPATKLFVGNIRAAGEALTLTAASRVGFIQHPWTPTAMDQASDRVNRIGQTSNKITIYSLVARNTIDMKFIDLLDEKRKVVEQVVDGKAPDKMTMLTELLKKYKKENT